jgi:hypothetical protein
MAMAYLLEESQELLLAVELQCSWRPFCCSFVGDADSETNTNRYPNRNI